MVAQGVSGCAPYTPDMGVPALGIAVTVAAIAAAGTSAGRRGLLVFASLRCGMTIAGVHLAAPYASLARRNVPANPMDRD